MRGRTRLDACTLLTVVDDRQLLPAERTVPGRHRQHAARNLPRRRRRGARVTGRLEVAYSGRPKSSCGGAVVVFVADSASKQILGETRIIGARVQVVGRPMTTTLRVLIVFERSSLISCNKSHC